MPQLKAILEKESQRDTPDQYATIHLFKEGNFFRAYEWSAWLCVRYFPDLKVTHRAMKSGDDIAFVGFPPTSIERFTPQGATVAEMGEGLVDILLPEEAFPPQADAGQLAALFSDWKRSQPLTEASKKRQEAEKAISERNAHPRLTDIMLRILAYPVEQHSPMECMAFLSEVKQQVSEIL